MLTAHERMLARRYLFPGAGGRLLMLVAAIGCAGVAIGVASLILVVSFMNGADARLSSQIVSVDGHLAVTRARHALPEWRVLAARAAKVPGVARATAVLDQTALVSVAGRVQPAILQGMRIADLRGLPVFQGGRALVAGHLPDGAGQVAIGTGLATRLGTVPGDPLSIVTVAAAADGQLTVEVAPLRITGLYETGLSDYDDRRVMLPIVDLQRIFARGDVASRIDVAAATEPEGAALLPALRRALGPDMVIRRWRDLNAAMFTALAQERLATAATVSIVTLIALGNIVSSLGLLVRFRVREIAIVRTMGASSASVARVFVGVGLAIGLAGEVIGVALGLALKAAKDPLAARLLAWTGPWPELEIFLDLPLTLSGFGLATILAGVGAGVLLATWLPARTAARIAPAAALRWD